MMHDQVGAVRHQPSFELQQALPDKCHAAILARQLRQDIGIENEDGSDLRTLLQRMM